MDKFKTGDNVIIAGCEGYGSGLCLCKDCKMGRCQTIRFRRRWDAPAIKGPFKAIVVAPEGYDSDENLRVKIKNKKHSVLLRGDSTIVRLDRFTNHKLKLKAPVEKRKIQARVQPMWKGSE